MNVVITRLRGLGFLAIGLVCLCGCPGGTVDSDGIPSGTYSGDVSCTIEVIAPAGAPQPDSFVVEISLDSEPGDSISLNDVPVEAGQMHLRSLPNADLSFEIVDIQRSDGEITVFYEPRPTLTGIEVVGDLVENYRSVGDRIEVDAQSTLTITDVDRTLELLITCEGSLPLSN